MNHPAPNAPGFADRLDLLQTFARIVESGSLSAAAAALGTTQPTVSRRLQQLERMLGRRLVHRSTRGLKLTEEGERGYRRALEVLADWGEFEAELRGIDVAPAGPLRVLVPHAFGQQLLVGPLAEFMGRYPQVTVEWLLRDEIPDFVGEGIDCGIFVGAVHDASAVVVRLAEVPRIAVAAPALLPGRKRPVHPRDLAALPWLAVKTFYQKEITLRHRRGETCRLALRPRLSTDNLYAAREAARRGLGVAVLSAWVAAEDIRRGDLVQVAPDWTADPLPVSVVYPYARVYPPQLRAFVDAMRELVPGALGGTVVRPARPA